ncbi:MAG: glycosyltransferase family 2 protein [Candidatus Krumholzibacteriota bacterium]|nr:glycosyltransferase family 2 protein [Candidatus Krumholzibacteriota bacterium]
MYSGKKVSLVIPAYNEEGSISLVLEEIEQVMRSQVKDFEIIIVDDGSTDKTTAVLQELPVKVVTHPRNRGYGAALKSGIRKAQGEIIIITDADSTYPAEQIPPILSHMDEYDMVVGARTGKNVKIPLIRKPAKWFLSKLANYLSGTDIPDLNSGLRAFRRETVLKFFNILPDGFSFTTTITLGMLCNGYTIKYLPIDYFKRDGKSKIRPIHDTLNFISLIVRTVMYFNPLKVFLPVSCMVSLLGVALLAYDIFVIRNLGDKTVLMLSIGFLIGILGLLADLIVKSIGRIGE